jgi:hypothetical protein
MPTAVPAVKIADHLDGTRVGGPNGEVHSLLTVDDARLWGRIAAANAASDVYAMGGRPLLALNVVGLIGAPILGGLIASRRPENPYGWLWLGLRLSLALAVLAQVYAAYSLVAQPGSLPAPRTVGNVVAGVGWTAGITSVPFLFLLFPTGRLPSRRWRFVAWAVVVAGAVALMVGPFVPGRSAFMPVENPLGIGGTVGVAITALTYGGVVIVLIAIVPSMLSLVLRYQRAGGVEREQLKWFAFATVLLVAEWVIQFFYEPPGAWDALVEVVPFTVLYVAVGVAVLKYRLYDIDRIINRTLVYGSLTVTLAAIYVGGVVVLQYLFRALTGQESQLAIVVSTLAIAALFVPLRRRVQALIDREFYRRKYDAAKTLEGFSAKLRDETDLQRLGNELVSVVQQTMQPEHVSLWLRPSRRVGGRKGEAKCEKIVGEELS